VLPRAPFPLQDWIQKQTQLLSIASDTDKLKAALTRNPTWQWKKTTPSTVAS